MSKGTVTATPAGVTGAGSLKVTEAGPNSHRVKDGDTLNFANPAPALAVYQGNNVEIEIISESGCKILRLI